MVHHGILGQKWGVRRYQNKDGSLTDEGRKRYTKAIFDTEGKNLTDAGRKRIRTAIEESKATNILKELRDPNISGTKKWKDETSTPYIDYNRMIDDMANKSPAYKSKEFLDLTAKYDAIFDKWDHDDFSSMDEDMAFIESYEKKDAEIYEEARSLIEQAANEILDSMDVKIADLLPSAAGEHKYVTTDGKLTKAGQEWIRENNGFESEKGHFMDTALSINLYYSSGEDERNEIRERYKDHKVDESWYDRNYYALYDKLEEVATKEAKRVTSAVADDIGDPNFKEWFSNKYEKRIKTDPKYDQLFKTIDKEYRKIANEWYPGKEAELLESVIGDGDDFMTILIPDIYDDFYA